MSFNMQVEMTQNRRSQFYEKSTRAHICALQVVPVILDLITKISVVRVYFPKDLRSLDSRMSVLKSVQEVQKRFPDGVPLLDPIEDMGIKDKGLKETVKVRSLWKKGVNVIFSTWIKSEIHAFPKSVKYTKENGMSREFNF